MTARNVQSRITKLEARSARPDEMLVIWRLPDGDVAEALKDATFVRGDKVICAEWFGSSAASETVLVQRSIEKSYATCRV